MENISQITQDHSNNDLLNKDEEEITLTDPETSTTLYSPTSNYDEDLDIDLDCDHG